jgi:hypothetical protein
VLGVLLALAVFWVLEGISLRSPCATADSQRAISATSERCNSNKEGKNKTKQEQ